VPAAAHQEQQISQPQRWNDKAKDAAEAKQRRQRGDHGTGKEPEYGSDDYTV
jgi:hypothetical protein